MGTPQFDLATLEQSLHEKDAPHKKGVVRFERSDAQKYHQQQRWDQNGIHQGQPLPHHVHEDGDDQTCLQQHEHDDQKPPEVTLKVEVVDRIRQGTENEEQPPDLEINADRMLLPLRVRMLLPLRVHMLLPLRVCHDLPYQR